MIHHKDLTENLRVCMNCDYHFRMSAEDRIKLFFKENEYEEIELDRISDDPLNFSDKKKYKDRFQEASKKSNCDEALSIGIGEINGIQVTTAIFEFDFLGGSMGAVVGKRFADIVDLSLKKKIPLVCFSTSGGARMQESMISLFQMGKLQQQSNDLKIQKFLLFLF